MIKNRFFKIDPVSATLAKAERHSKAAEITWLKRALRSTTEPEEMSRLRSKLYSRGKKFQLRERSLAAAFLNNKPFPEKNKDNLPDSKSILKFVLEYRYDQGYFLGRDTLHEIIVFWISFPGFRLSHASSKRALCNELTALSNQLDTIKALVNRNDASEQERLAQISSLATKIERWRDEIREAEAKILQIRSQAAENHSPEYLDEELARLEAQIKTVYEKIIDIRSDDNNEPKL